jgi:hypothetical protein
MDLKFHQVEIFAICDYICVYIFIYLYFIPLCMCVGGGFDEN